MQKKVLLKDALFNRANVTLIAGEIHHVYPRFAKKNFVRDVVARFPELELKARITWIAECLKMYLPPDYPSALGILLAALPQPNNPSLSDNDFGNFVYASYAEYVAKNGCTKRYLRRSLRALHEITQRFSAEDAIRYFINAFPEETLKTLLIWSEDSHYHVRRLASEGTRPKLPWSQKIHISIATPIPILDKLFYDKTRFVTRSVANHMNDISKIDPELAITTLARWKVSGKQTPVEMDYIVRHALRTLVKQGNPNAINMLGFTHQPRVSLVQFVLPKKVRMSTALEFSFTVRAQEDTALLVDYILYFQNKAGACKSKKVFKLTKRFLQKNQSVTIAKRHLLRQFMTTRTLYRGRHTIALQINGMSFGTRSFEVV